MRLSGWKEIAGHLKIGIRTAQRWHNEFHLPVIRTRNLKTPVIAESKNLDDWGRRRSDLDRLSKKTSAIIKRTTEEGRNFVRTELVTGKELAKLAARSTNDKAIARRTKAARKAYDTISRLLAHATTLPASEKRQFKKDLQGFKRELEKLGERF